MANIRNTLSGKTCPERLVQIGDKILELCSKKSQRAKFQCLILENGQKQEWLEAINVELNGECSMLNTGAFPSVANESFLSQILQMETPEKYFLSAKACAGILRRAKERGKKLPKMLEEALTAQAQPTS